MQQQTTLPLPGFFTTTMCPSETASSAPGNPPLFLQDAAAMVALMDDAVFATWYDGKGHSDGEYTFNQMWQEAGAIAYRLRYEWNVQKGERVILIYSPGLHFFSAFFGCLRAGVIAALVYPPDPCNLAASLAKFTKVVANCTAVLCLMDSQVAMLRRASRFNPLSRTRGLWPSDLPFQQSDDAGTTKCTARSFDETTTTETDVAFLQYTSGSTGDPKGVMVTYAALRANIALIHNGFKQAFEEDGGWPTERLTGFSWLPQYHDLGLIYATIAPFLGGWRMHCMSPIAFLQSPLLWLQLIARHRCHWSVAPDFAYRLAARHMRAARAAGTAPAPGELDLSCVHNLQNGTEPVRPDTRRAFEAEFAPYSLRERWFQAGYGLAENVVGVCWVHEFRPCPSNPKLVSVGCERTFDSSLVVVIADPQGRTHLTADGAIGELWIGGPSLAAGYWGQTKLSAATFGAELAHKSARGRVPLGPYLRTGDLAFMEGGHLYICGRIKDVIIAGGRNIYPQDAEAAAADARPHEVRPGCVAAFSADESARDGSLIVVFELRTGAEAHATGTVCDVRATVAAAVGLAPCRVVAIREKTIPKTTSGKIRRRATREALFAGELAVVADVNFDEAGGGAAGTGVCEQPQVGGAPAAAADAVAGDNQLPVVQAITWAGARLQRRAQVARALAAALHRVRAPASGNTPTEAAESDAGSDGLWQLEAAEGGGMHASASLADAGLTSVEAVQLQSLVSASVGLPDVDMQLLLSGESVAEVASQLELQRFPPSPPPSPPPQLTRAAGALVSPDAELEATVPLSECAPVTAGAAPAAGGFFRGAASARSSQVRWSTYSVASQAAGFKDLEGGTAAEPCVEQSRRAFVHKLAGPLPCKEKRLPLPAVLAVQLAGLLAAPAAFFLALVPVRLLLPLVYNSAGAAAAFALAPVYWAAALTVLVLQVAVLRAALFWRRPLRPGVFPIYGPTHLRCWLLDTLLLVIETVLRRYSTPAVRTLVLRVLGASVGRGVKTATRLSASCALLRLGDDAACDGRTWCHMFVDQMLVLAPVEVGAGALLRTHSVVEPGVVIGAGATLALYGVLSMGAAAPAHSLCQGNPAIAVTKGAADSRLAPASGPGDKDCTAAAAATESGGVNSGGGTSAQQSVPRVVWPVVEAFIVFPYALAVPLGALLACAHVLLSAVDWAACPPLLWPLFSAALLAGAAAAAALVLGSKWLLLGRVRPGPLRPSAAWRHAAYRTAVDTVLNPWLVLLPPTASTALLRAVGARMGRGATVLPYDMAPLLKAADLVSAGDGAFIGGGGSIEFESSGDDALQTSTPAGTRADTATGSSSDVDSADGSSSGCGGAVRVLHPVQLGRNAYIGNKSVVGHGSVLRDGTVLAACSCAPPLSVISEGRVWAGNVARDAFRNGACSTTARDTGASSVKGDVNTVASAAETVCAAARRLLQEAALVLTRCAFFATPLAVLTLVYHALGLVVPEPQSAVTAALRWAALSALALAAAVAALWLAVVVLVRTVLRAPAPPPGGAAVLAPGSARFALWLVGFEYLASLVQTLPFIFGTPLAPLTYRLLGTRLGAHVFMGGPVWFYEPMAVTVGDGVTMNADATVAPHSRETDATVTITAVEIRAGATLGFDAPVHGGSVVPQGVLLGSQSRLMPGQRARVGQQYDDTPARRFACAAVAATAVAL